MLHTIRKEATGGWKYSVAGIGCRSLGSVMVLETTRKETLRQTACWKGNGGGAGNCTGR